MSDEELLALAAQIADKHQAMKALGSTEREALEGAAIDGLLCGSSEDFRRAWQQ